MPTGSYATGYSRSIQLKKVTLSSTVNAAYASEFFFDDTSTSVNVPEAGSAITFSNSAVQTKETSNFAATFKNSSGKTVAGTYYFRAISTTSQPGYVSYNDNTYQAKFNDRCAACAPLTGWCEAT